MHYIVLNFVSEIFLILQTGVQLLCTTKLSKYISFKYTSKHKQTYVSDQTLNVKRLNKMVTTEKNNKT